MAITRTGPLTVQPNKVALGLAQIRVGAAAANIASTEGVLAIATSIGNLASTNFNGETEFWRLESGFPMLEDLTLPIREKATLECAFRELTIRNMALARGIDPDTLEKDEYDVITDDEIALGGLSAPDYVRMEAVYTFPDRHQQMVIIFPRANVTSSLTMDLQQEDAAAVPITFEAKRADSGLTDGDAGWDSKPLGVIMFRAADVT